MWIYIWQKTKVFFLCSKTKMWSSALKQKCVHLLPFDMQKYGHLLTDKSAFIGSQTRIWSSAHRQECGHLLTDKIAFTGSQTRVWSSAHRQKCGHWLSENEPQRWKRGNLPHHTVTKYFLLDFVNSTFGKLQCSWNKIRKRAKRRESYFSQKVIRYWH